MILACVMIMIAVSHVPCVSYDADWLAGCLAGLFGCLAGWLVGLCCIRKQDLSSADTPLYLKMIMLISITGWLASWLGWLAGRCGLGNVRNGIRVASCVVPPPPPSSTARICTC